MKHRRHTVWSRLREAGLVLIVLVGLATIGFALGMAIGLRFVG